MMQDADKNRLPIENLPDAFAYHQIVTDDDGKPVDYVFLEVNSAFEEMTGLKREKVIGKKVTAVLPGIEKGKFDWIAVYGQVALSGEPARFESFSEPLERWYEVSAYSDKPGYFATVFRDITETKKTEQALRESEEKYRFLAENMGNVAWIMDMDLNTTYISPSSTMIIGFTPEERLQQKIDEIMTPESLALIMQRFHEEMAKERDGIRDPDSSIVIEAEFYHKNGGTVWMENHVKAVRDSNGELTAWIPATL